MKYLNVLIDKYMVFYLTKRIIYQIPGSILDEIFTYLYEFEIDTGDRYETVTKLLQKCTFVFGAFKYEFKIYFYQLLPYNLLFRVLLILLHI